MSITIIEQQTMHSIQEMAKSTKRIADILERIATSLEADTDWVGELRQTGKQEIYSPEVTEQLREQLFAADTVLDPFSLTGTTAEEIKAMGAAIMAVRQGFADLAREAEPDE